MKKCIPFVFLIAVQINCFAQPDTWVNIIDNGFGVPYNLGTGDFTVFKNKIFVLVNTKNGSPALPSIVYCSAGTPVSETGQKSPLFPRRFPVPPIK